ncbi:MAG TPA: 30S ribosomal protein S16 [Bacteroidales bacterium]|nr:30S ribosomal protein S16 [Bacteroidales bacterium]
MAVKIRLARKGRKKLAFYHVVVADSRSPRDGRYIEKIGSYNPVTNPATIELDFDKALGWLQNGAIPTDTCRAILSYKGVLLKKHLLEGVKKGAFDEVEAARRFEEWVKQNEEKIETKESNLEKSQDDELGQRLTVEKGINEARAAKLAKRKADIEAKALAQTVAAIREEDTAQTDDTTQIEDTEPAEEIAPVEEAAPVEEVVAVEEVPPTEEPIQPPIAEETASEPVAEDKPQE